MKKPSTESVHVTVMSAAVIALAMLVVVGFPTLDRALEEGSGGSPGAETQMAASDGEADSRSHFCSILGEIARVTMEHRQRGDDVGAVLESVDGAISDLAGVMGGEEGAVVMALFWRAIVMDAYEHAVVPERDRAGFSEDFGATIALECLGSQQEI